MPVIPLVPSDSPTLISLLRLSARHLDLAALASQPLKSGTLSLYLSIPVPVLAPSVVTSRPCTASRPSNPLNPSSLAPQIRLCWPLCAFIKYIYLLTLQRPLTITGINLNSHSQAPSSTQPYHPSISRCNEQQQKLRYKQAHQALHKSHYRCSHSKNWCLDGCHRTSAQCRRVWPEKSYSLRSVINMHS